MMQTDKNISLFLKATGIEQPSELLPQIQSFFQDASPDKHIIFKRSILYFYDKDKIINSIPFNSDENNVFTFDGTKVARLKPDFYTGGATSVVVGAAALNEFNINFSNNNNNNNNNNNGNNNG